jgi:hypothetical protein
LHGFFYIPVYDVYPGMSAFDLSHVFKADLGDVLEVLLSLPYTRHIRSERQPIKDTSILTALAKKMGVKFRFVKDPSTISEEVERNLDLVAQPQPDPKDLKVEFKVGGNPLIHQSKIKPMFSPVLRSSPSWATLTTAKRPCSTTSEGRESSRASLAGSRSTSARSLSN